MLDSKKVKGTIKLGGNGATGTAGKVMTLKQGIKEIKKHFFKTNLC